jgi:hypothetical protein
MAPDTRWFLAALLAVSAVVWVECGWNRPHGLRRTLPTLSLTRADDLSSLDAEGSADLEGRWIGHGLIVKHHPDDGRAHFFAQLDADGRWSGHTSDDAR